MHDFIIVPETRGLYTELRFGTEDIPLPCIVNPIRSNLGIVSLRTKHETIICIEKILP